MAISPFRLALKEQPRGDWFWVGMEPISGSNGYPDVFYVRRDDDGRRWLFAYYASPEDHCSLGGEVVFCLRK